MDHNTVRGGCYWSVFKWQVRLMLAEISTFRSVDLRGTRLEASNSGKRLYLLAGAAMTKYQRLRSLNNKDFFLLQYWRLEVQHQSISEIGFFWSQSLCLVDGWLSSLSVFTWSSFCGVCAHITSYKDTSHFALGSICLTSFYLKSSWKAQFPNIWKLYLGLRLKHMNWVCVWGGGGHNSALNRGCY